MKEHLIDAVGSIGIALMMSGALMLAHCKYAGAAMLMGILICGVVVFAERKEIEGGDDADERHSKD